MENSNDACTTNSAAADIPTTCLSTIFLDLPQLHGHRPTLLPLADVRNARDDDERSTIPESSKPSWTAGESTSPTNK